MRIALLVIPEEPAPELNVRPKAVFPVETAQAAALLSGAGHDVYCRDLNLFPPERWMDEVRSFLNDSRPDVLAATPQFLTFNIRESHRIVQETFAAAKRSNPGMTTVLAGAYATSFPDRALSETGATHVLRGEFEFSLARLVERLQTSDSSLLADWENDVVSPLRSIPDLKDLPFPAYDICGYQRYFEHPEKGNLRYPERSRRFTSYQATRGCTCACCFCNVPFLRGGRRHRHRPVEQALDHLGRLSGELGIEEVHFIDENLTLNRRFALELFQGMVERKFNLSWIPAGGISVYTLDRELLEAMRASGCYRLTLAFESGSQQIIDSCISKPVRLERDVPKLDLARKMGFELVGYFVVGFPGETAAQRRETVALAEHPAFDYVVFSIATPQKGTVLAEKCASLLAPNTDLATLGKRSQASYATGTFSRRELEELRILEWDRINFSAPERRERVCRMMGLAPAELEAMRRTTAARLGGAGGIS